MTKMGTFGLPIDANALVDELRSRILDECDYALEAKNQEFFRTLYAADAGVHVPRVIADRSSKRVLTTELVDAMRFDEFTRTADQATKNRAGEVIFFEPASPVCFGTASSTPTRTLAITSFTPTAK